jgi:hypothetical protein
LHGKIISVNSISEFQIPGIGGVEKMKCEKNTLRLHFGVSDTGRLRSQELRLFNTGVPELRNPESRNPERGTSTRVLQTGK